MSRESKTYSKEEQLNLLREYQESGLSKNAFCRRHEISCVKVLNYWLKKHDSSKEPERLTLRGQPFLCRLKRMTFQSKTKL